MTEPPSRAGPPAGGVPAPPPQLRRVVFPAVASALTSLIPVPFLDELALRRVREQMVRAILEEHGLPAPERAVELLAGSHLGPGVGGRVTAYLRTIALQPVRRVFRKMLLMLWVKDCVDVASVSLHQGYLLQCALARGDLDARLLEGTDAAERVHAAIVAACREVDSRPVNQALRRLFASSRLVGALAMRALLAPLRTGGRVPEPGEQAEVSSIAERLLAALAAERSDFAALEERYARHLAAAAARGGGGAPR